MFVVIEEKTFHASHRIKINGVWEDMHEHNWLLRLSVKSKKLDQDQLVVDFLKLQQAMSDLLACFEGKEINSLPPFDLELNPSAEYLAFHFYEKLAPQIDTPDAKLFRVELRESPTSWGIYETKGLFS